MATRSNFLGRWILGNGFTWDDLPPYVLGGDGGWGDGAVENWESRTSVLGIGLGLFGAIAVY